MTSRCPIGTVPTIRDRLAAARAGWKAGSTPPVYTVGRSGRRRLTTEPVPKRRLRSAPLPRATVSRTGVREVVATVLQAVTVLTAVGALLFTGLSLQATRDQVALGEQGQITDRFSRAIDQLGQEGSGKLSIRLGGIYALERIMHDSPADEPAVIEVLCAFIRTHAQLPPPPAVASPDARRALPASSQDVQAALVVLGRRPNPDGKRNRRLDLSGTLLSMPGADLPNAHLAQTDLLQADLSGANLDHADLDHADLRNANLALADLNHADLRGANLALADLAVADLRGADLRGAYVAVAHLNSAFLVDANLAGVYLVDADLNGARLQGADLNGADLGGADLRGADLTGAFGLTTDQLAAADLDAYTRLPAGVARPSPAPSPST